MDDILNYKKCANEDYYSILGCNESSTADQILAEYKVLSLLYHPDKNPDDPNAVMQFQKIQKAKELLTDPEKRALYDKWRRCGFTIPFEQFLNLSKAAHTSVHWVTKKQKDLMLENACDLPENCCEERSTYQCFMIYRISFLSIVNFQTKRLESINI
ncbi:dnaJ homolog subfamily C member 12-like [Stegodyphus dumicola]|uniref:dnaJ homolog subfamily C member 12-like n=1 Tax=Stegodyphus dumicola TaxID=202533 RepID=UPI0015B26C75|nr:dnaJ homolog subfamily C member 12-like [Stegodyphus dumicola]